jgi:hypothetical protein
MRLSKGKWQPGVGEIDWSVGVERCEGLRA